MVGGDQVALPERIRTTAKTADALRGTQKPTGGKVTESYYDARGYELELRFEIRTARLDLVRERITISGRPAPDDIRHIAVLSGQADLLAHQTVQQLARTTDEGQTLTVLFGAWALTDEHEIRLRIAHAEYHVGPAAG
jgi:hypothetical protein